MVIIILNKQRSLIFSEGRLFQIELSKSFNYSVEKNGKNWKTLHFGNFFFLLLFLNSYYTNFFLLYSGRLLLSVVTHKIQCIIMNLFQPKWFFDSLINYHDFLQESKIAGLCYFNKIQKMDSLHAHSVHIHTYACIYKKNYSPHFLKSGKVLL